MTKGKMLAILLLATAFWALLVVLSVKRPALTEQKTELPCPPACAQLAGAVPNQPKPAPPRPAPPGGKSPAAVMPAYGGGEALTE
jgi:hypothetical protein